MDKTIYKAIKDNALDLNEYFFLYSDLHGMGLDIPLTTDQIRKLEKLGFWKNHELTDKGKAFVVSLSSAPPGSDEGFDEFYNSFPLSDEHLPFFEKTRPIRCKYGEVKTAYREAVNELPYEQLIQAAKNYVATFDQPTSGPLLHSPYKFMKGPLNFLREKHYLKYK